MKTIKPLFLFSTFVLIVSLACSTLGDITEQLADATEPAPTEPPPTLTATPEPTLTAEPSDTPEPTSTPTLEPTSEPTSTATPDATATPKPTRQVREIEERPDALLLESESYLHSDGYIESAYPVGWEVEEGFASLAFLAPDESGYIYIQTVNTIYELDAASFERFATAVEVSVFEYYADYEQIDFDVDEESGNIAVSKMVTYDDVPQVVVSFYMQFENVIFSIDFWVSEDLFDAYSDAYEEIYETAIFDLALASEIAPYHCRVDFFGPEDLFVFDVPCSWLYEWEEEEDVRVDTFFSPDDNALIQSVAYDDGTEVSRSDAGAFALALLNQLYAEDIRIIDDQVQGDGSERLIWESPSGGYSGMSFFETRGTTFLLLTFMVDDHYEDDYGPIFDDIISTYRVP